MDTKIGTPTNAYYKSQGVYMRDFTGGKVISNPSANPRTVSVGAGYTLLDGTVAAKSMTLAAYSAEILLSQNK